MQIRSNMRFFPWLMLLPLLAFSPHARADALNPSCRAGDPFACLEGGPSLPGAQKACELGQPKGCMVSGGLLLNGKVAKPAQALVFFDKACAMGDAMGCYESGKLVTDPASKLVNYPRAFLVLYKSCRQGYGPACTVAGALHADGAGTPKDLTRAAMAFRNGCERKDPQGCMLLGRSLVQPVDAATAFQQGCLLGQAEGCTEVAAFAKKGVKPEAKLKPLLDPMVETEKALRNLPGGRNPVAFTEVDKCPKVSADPACAGGDLAVCQQRGDLQQNGGDGAAAYCMKRQACERGDGYACSQLGYAHEGGGLPSDPKLALGWYEKGCANGDPSACETSVRLVDVVEPTLTANQRATRKLQLRIQGCALEDAGDCSLVYKDLLTKIADPALAQRAWITLGRWCEKEKRDGPACTVVVDRRKAIVLERDCAAGQAVACREAAGLFPDPQRESALLGKACSLGDCESCVGRKTVEGVKLADAKASQVKASEVCPEECKAAPADVAEPKSCVYGVRAMTELGGAANEKKALGLAEEQCRRGYTCGLLAELYVVAEHLTPGDEKRIGAVLEKACVDKRPNTCQAQAELAQVKPAREQCAQGKVEGCLKLGDQLKLSNVELPQISLAWERACKLGSNLGCVRHWASLQTAMSRDSKAIQESHDKAARACEAGEQQICIELANHLKFRSGDPSAVAELKTVGEMVVTKLAGECDAGSAEACETAARFLQFKKELNGEARAKEFIRKACEKGASARCMEIAEASVRTKDFAGAAEFGGKACMFGSPAGCRLLTKHRSELVGNALVEADRALGLACGKKVVEACALAADSGVPIRIEAPAAPIPLTNGAAPTPLPLSKN